MADGGFGGGQWRYSTSQNNKLEWPNEASRLIMLNECKSVAVLFHIT
jgi:hypothetical protein